MKLMTQGILLCIFSQLLFGILLALLIIPMETMLIPQFTIINALGLVNNRLAVIIPGLASVFNIYLFRNFLLLFLKKSSNQPGWMAQVFCGYSSVLCYPCLNLQ